jgi:replicative DNA helicase
MVKTDSVTLFNNELEEMALVSLIKGQGVVRDFLFGNLKEEHFFTPFGKEIFARIRVLVKEKNQLPSEIGVIGDLTISENSKTIIKNSEFLLNESYLKTQGEVQTLIDQLSHWTKLRKLHQVHVLSGDALLDPSKNISNTVSSLTNKLYEINTNSESFESSITKVADASTVDLLKSRILSKRLDQYIPTGFKQFDQANIGLPRGGLTILAATTGGGKCLTGASSVPTSQGNLTLEQLWDLSSGELNSERFNRLDREIFVYTDKLRKKKITHTYRTKGKTIKITFDDGSTIQGLKEHKIWVLNKFNVPTFKRLDEISEGDRTYKFNQEEILKLLQD